MGKQPTNKIVRGRKPKPPANNIRSPKQDQAVRKVDKKIAQKQAQIKAIKETIPSGRKGARAVHTRGPVPRAAAAAMRGVARASVPAAVASSVLRARPVADGTLTAAKKRGDLDKRKSPKQKQPKK